MEVKLPAYAKIALNLISVSILGWLIYIGSDILMPLAFATLFSILLLPVNNFLERIKVPRIVAIILTLSISSGILVMIIYFLSFQISSFTKDIPALSKQLHEHATTLQNWIEQKFHINQNNQLEYINEAADKTIASGSKIVGQTVVTISGMLVFIIVIPIYCFLILFYRDLIKKFFIQLYAAEKTEKIQLIFSQTKYIIQNYMVGLLIEMLIVAALNCTGFFILGIHYALLLGVIAAILNLIPYIGMLIANVLCMIVTLTTSDSLTTVALVATVLIVVQFIDNNILMPKIVGSKVRINALITIIGVFIGGSLAGVSGMFISIPTIAILKVIFDSVDSLNPFGILLGDEDHKKPVFALKKKQKK
jgi:predicted PurR-regulated permease PerM